MSSFMSSMVFLCPLMAKTKIAKDSLEFYEIKAKYEADRLSDEKLGSEYGISAKTIQRFAKEGKWEKGSEYVKQVYDSKKITHKEKILTQFKRKEEKHADIIISKMAEKEGKKIALLTLQSESFKKQIEHEYAEILLLQMQNVKSTLEATKGGKITDTEFEYVDTIQGKTGTVLRKTKTLTMKDHGLDLIKLGQGLGHLLTPQQQNNTQINIGSQPPTQNIPLEVATQEEAGEVRKELLKQFK